MKGYRILGVGLSICIFLLVSCGQAKQDDNITDYVRVTMFWYETIDAYRMDSSEQVVIQEQAEIDDLVSILYDLIDADGTVNNGPGGCSRPMDFPRYRLCFEGAGGEQITLSIDINCVFCEDLTGRLGNHGFPEDSGVSYYQDIDAVFRAAVSNQA